MLRFLLLQDQLALFTYACKCDIKLENKNFCFVTTKNNGEKNKWQFQHKINIIKHKNTFINYIALS